MYINPFSISAASTAAIEPGIVGIGVQYMFLTLGLICVVTTPGVLLLRKFGPKWRRNRMEKHAAVLNAESEKTAVDTTK
jgi:hypothetical protein